MFSNWNYPTQVLVGAGRIQELASICKQRKIIAPLLVTDKDLAKFSFVSDLLAQCRDEGLDIEIFTQIKPNPTGSNINLGIDAFKSGHHDAVIAIGGGSALDAGKAIALVANQDCDLFELEDIGDNWTRADNTKIVPTIAIPTTAGTGSEVGRAAVIINENQQRKTIIFHPLMMPECVILDPELTLGLPATLSAATGMDALSHSLEAFCAPTYHPMAEGIAIEGIRLVKAYLPIVVADGSNIEARTQMLVASMMGATAFQRGLGAMHALAHPLGSVFDAHHGMLNAILMPYVLKANQRAISSSISRLTKYLGIDNGFDGFLSWVLELRKELNIPHTLDQIIDHDIQYSRIAAMAFEDPSASTNPILFTPSQYEEILKSAYKGAL
ncbi:MAG: iron-containing alcohol dehydrogenase [Pseudomonadales bacterium]|nr:iron-containing alcohol dehydrogenase [Pseudomonadales bacterium]